MAEIELKKITAEEAQKAYKRLEQSFCKEELRDYKDYLKVLEKPEYRLMHIVSGGENVGLIGVWDLQDYLFIEHLAINSESRGRGYGHSVIKKLQDKYKKIALEMEPPVQDNQIRRYNFYAGLGFKLNRFEYFQPPYRAEDKPLPLKLMTYPELVCESCGLVEKIYGTVYGIARLNL